MATPITRTSGQRKLHENTTAHVLRCFVVLPCYPPRRALSLDVLLPHPPCFDLQLLHELRVLVLYCCIYLDMPHVSVV